MTPIGTITPFVHNVATYAVNTCSQGGGIDGVGGPIASAQLEVPNMQPMLSQFVLPDVPPVASIRAPVWSSSTSGDSMFATSLLSTIKPEVLTYKRCPKFHFIDFLEFGDVLAQWVTQIQTAFFTTSEGVVQTDANGTAVDNYACPISLQEMLILLRNEILASWTSQSGCQSLYPVLPAAADDNQFVAYTASTTTAPQGVIGMLLPQSFVENLRCLHARAVHGKTAEDALLFVPVLGQYVADSLVQSNYTFSYTFLGSPATHASFGPGGIVPIGKKRSLQKGIKGEMVEVITDVLETAIDLIDGNSSGTYVFINSQSRLQQLATLWNKWLETQSLNTFSEPLMSVGSDTGPNILSFIGSTRFWTTVSSLQLQRQKDCWDERITSNAALSSTVYSARYVYAQSYREKPFGATVTQFFNQMILPIAKLNTSDKSAGVLTSERYQIIMGEPNLQSFSTTGDTGVTLATLHSAYASKMVRAPNAPPGDWGIFFGDCERQGNGGVLSGLAAQWAESMFGTTIGSIAKGIAGFLPF